MIWPHQEAHSKIGGFLKEGVFGFNDGLVSTFAVIAGLTGGAVHDRTILLAALATLFAGAFSMGLGTYLGSKSERELYESEKQREIDEMREIPDAERREIHDIYHAKGFRGELLEKIVRHITSDKKLWLDTMMREELGFAESPPKPGLNGLIMAIAFVVGSAIPTVPYFFNVPRVFYVTLLLAVFGLLVAGALKTRFTKKNPILSAIETLFIGAIAALGSYGIGLLFA